MKKYQLTDLANSWPNRPLISHKGTFGKVLIIAGNTNYGGAGILSASAAIYTGAGLVTLATDLQNFTAARSQLAEMMLIDYNDSTQLIDILNSIDGIVIGPGLGTTESAWQLLQLVLNNVPKDLPLVIDGSAIDLLASHEFYPNNKNIIYTPHQMEWQRLSKIKISSQNQITNQAVVNQLNQIVILKKPHTEIYFPNQEPVQITAGNPGMATGGMGDTLTGILIATIVQNKDLFISICNATFLHSYTADLIFEKEAVVLPHRLIKLLPVTLKSIIKKGSM